MKQRLKFRIYPTTSQKTALAKLFGCTRVVWNDALAHCQQEYREGRKKPNNTQLSSRLTQLKKTEEKIWLGEVSAIPLQQSLRDLEVAYSNFFKSCQGKRKGKKVKSPKFKSRKFRQSARFTDNGFKINQQNVYLAKIGKLKIVWSRELPSKPSSVTVIKDSANRYFLSFVCDVNSSPLAPNNNSIGIDLGIIDFATLNNGEKIKSPKPLKHNLKRLRRLQKNLSRKQKGSKRHEVARLKVAKLHAKITDIRTDFLHQLSTKLIRENQTIALEDLNVSGMVKNRKLSRAISDLGWRSFRTMLETKGEIYGRDVRIINRWEATSQTCSSCGFKGGKKELNIREWTCLNCGAVHDRDVNAATNILKVAGGHPETKNGRGEKIRLSNKKAHLSEASTTPQYKQLSLF
ncbi:transposase, IS605 OrfB family [Rippkaea orientalis PCC 8801]|uniref:Transposase, IS605 OrfB family n=1 Tax=Rippkaea orientalis (strain PCC 8801 / RF-1) TaxID=41431 RepID=B7JWL6_RIPO1|nr:RNA-guided endonuclease TnpB family protein [Rippkaea orientalis]ACK65171.1 transposase, IS605 OrfB family [Rippkaea orientalis PCC 8801]ACK68357.1 transposase, IS605 OrfB family [Rippkaea orientalis PCC 8801]